MLYEHFTSYKLIHELIEGVVSVVDSGTRCGHGLIAF